MQHWIKHHTRIGVLIRIVILGVCVWALNTYGSLSSGLLWAVGSVILGLFIFLLIYELYGGVPAYLYKRKDSKPEHQQVIRAAARPRTVSEERGMSMGLEQRLEMREEHKKKMRSRAARKPVGHFPRDAGAGSSSVRVLECKLPGADLDYSYQHGWRCPPGIWLSARPTLVLVPSGVAQH
jgi:hypothetical protein